MKYLLDTHLLIWACKDDSLLPEEARACILDPRNEIYYSAMAMLEVAIKHAKHPDNMTISAPQLQEYATMSGYYSLPLEDQHTFLLDTLSRAEDAPPHSDPFDRVMIAQAKAENMLFLTHDALLPFYNEVCIRYV